MALLFAPFANIAYYPTMKISSDQIKGDIYAICSGLLYGLLGYFGVSIMRANLSAENMLFWRFLFAALFLLPAAIYALKPSKLSLKQILSIIVINSVFFAFTSYFYFLACRYIGSGLAMVIFFTYPMIVTLLSWIFEKQRITKIYYLSLTLILIGLLALMQKNAMDFDLTGIALATISSFFYALYIFSSKKQSKAMSPIAGTFLVNIGTCLVCLLLTLWQQSFVIPDSVSVWGNIIGLAIISTALPMLLMLKALKYISANKASILSVLEPVCVLIVGIVFLNEEVTWLQISGATTILIGALVVQLDGISKRD